MKEIAEIIGEKEAIELRQELHQLLEESPRYEDIEELMMDYGLEMDYFLGLI